MPVKDGLTYAFNSIFFLIINLYMAHHFLPTTYAIFAISIVVHFLSLRLLQRGYGEGIYSSASEKDSHHNPRVLVFIMVLSNALYAFIYISSRSNFNHLESFVLLILLSNFTLIIEFNYWELRRASQFESIQNIEIVINLLCIFLVFLSIMFFDSVVLPLCILVSKSLLFLLYLLKSRYKNIPSQRLFRNLSLPGDKKLFVIELGCMLASMASFLFLLNSKSNSLADYRLVYAIFSPLTFYIGMERYVFGRDARGNTFKLVSISFFSLACLFLLLFFSTIQETFFGSFRNISAFLITLILFDIFLVFFNSLLISKFPSTTQNKHVSNSRITWFLFSLAIIYPITLTNNSIQIAFLLLIPTLAANLTLIVDLTFTSAAKEIKLVKIFGNFTPRSLKSFTIKFLSHFVNLLFDKLRIPISDQVFFIGYPNFEDQGYAIAKECRSRNIPLYLLVSGTAYLKNDEDFLGMVIPVSSRSIRAIFFLKTSKWIIFTHGISAASYLRKDQVSINVWHGTPIKKIGFADGREIQDSTFLTIDPNFEKAYSGMYSPTVPSPKKLPFGLPRNDFLKPIEVGALKSRKIIWMPTYRKASVGDLRTDGSPGQFGFGVGENELIQIDKVLRTLKVFLDIKFHPMSNCSLPESLTNIRIFVNGKANGTFYSHLNQYDALISDYSSIMLDFLYTRKPILVFAPDFVNYKETRGFTLDLTLSIEATFCKDVEDLVAAIGEIYQDDRVQSLKNMTLVKPAASSMLFDFLLT